MVSINARVLLENIWPSAPSVPITSVVTDNRQARPGSVFVAIKGERADGHDYAPAAVQNGAAIVLAQHPVEGVDPAITAIVADPLDAMIQMGANYRAGFSPIVLGITGSVGKTTTKELAACVFSTFGETLKTEGNQNNEIGMPNTLFRLDEQTKYAVIEMGMQGLGEIRKLSMAAQPHGAIITKIGTSHIESLGSIENILKAKLEICDGLPYGAPVILNGDDAQLRSAILTPNVRPVYVGIENEEAEVRAVDIRPEGASQFFAIEDKTYGRYEAYLPAAGRHNVSNALLAYTAATRLGLNAAQSAAALSGYAPAGMRQRVVDRGGITLIEDCYNANPDSMRAALEVLAEMQVEGRRIAVLGDMLELGGISEAAHRDLAGWCKQAGVALLVTVGRHAAYAAEEADRLGLTSEWCATNAEAAALLSAEAKPGDAVLVKASRGMHFEEILEAFSPV